MNSPQAWSESIGSSVWSRSKRVRPRSRVTSPSSASICLSSGTVIARLVDERELVEPVELGHQVLEVAGEAGQQVVHHLVGQEDAAPVGLAAQRGAHLGLGQRLQREHMAPAEPRAQVLAHGRSTGGTLPAASDRPRLRAAASTNSAKAACCCAASSASQSSRTTSAQRSVDLPGRGRRGVEPADSLRRCCCARCDQRVQQVRLAAARRPPEVDRRRAGAERAAGGPAPRRSAPGRKFSKVRAGSGADRQRDLLHPPM